VGNSVGDIYGDVWIDVDVAGDTIVPGTEGYYVLLHEFGHAMGLGHPALPYTEDNRQYTVMDYVPHPTMSGDVTGYQLYDIAALQYLYGANIDNAATDDVYAFGDFDGAIKTIWDGGGHDSFDMSAATYAVQIDLRDGAFSTVAGAGSNNVAIAYDTVIEDAVGGSYDDRLTGNDVANVLNGGGGDDRLTGGAGADTFVFDANWGRDVIVDFNSGEDLLDFRGSGTTFADLVVISDGADTQIAFNDSLVTLLGVGQVTQGDFYWDLA
jgi:Ca2+-binding RTX toxin-like protein